MITFYITLEERKRAQARAAELDIDKSDPPGRCPYVWDNRQNSVKRWYEYGSAEEKIGAIYFERLASAEDASALVVECTTEMMHRALRPAPQLHQTVITDPEEHEKLVELFFMELLKSPRGPQALGSHNRKCPAAALTPPRSPTPACCPRERIRTRLV